MQGGTALAYVPVLPRAEAFDPLDEDEKKIPPIQYTEKSLYLNKPYVVRVRRTLQDIANLQNAIKQGDYATVGDFAFINPPNSGIGKVTVPPKAPKYHPKQQHLHPRQ